MTKQCTNNLCKQKATKSVLYQPIALTAVPRSVCNQHYKEWLGL